nr:hypothetical protein RF1 [Ceratostigma minus]WBR76443.1 hypothetical protein RF1 [Ceratostigma minus]
MNFLVFLLAKLGDLCTKIINSVVVVGLYYGFLATLAIGPSYLALLRTLIMEKKTGKRGAKRKAAAITGFIMGQLLTFISIYHRPLHLALGSPHTISFLIIPFLYGHFVWRNHFAFTERDGDFLPSFLLQRAFLQNFVCQLCNPLIFPNSTLVRLVNVSMFRCKNKMLFLTSSFLGWLIGQFFLMKCLGVVLVWIRHWMRHRLSILSVIRSSQSLNLLLLRIRYHKLIRFRYNRYKKSLNLLRITLKYEIIRYLNVLRSRLRSNKYIKGLLRSKYTKSFVAECKRWASEWELLVSDLKYRALEFRYFMLELMATGRIYTVLLYIIGIFYLSRTPPTIFGKNLKKTGQEVRFSLLPEEENFVFKKEPEGAEKKIEKDFYGKDFLLNDKNGTFYKKDGKTKRKGLEEEEGLGEAQGGLNRAFAKEIYKKRHFCKHPPTFSALFNYQRYKATSRYVINSQMRNSVRNEMSEFFFYTCQNDGQVRICFTHPYNLSAFFENLKQNMYFYFFRKKKFKKIICDELDKLFCDELHNFSYWIYNNEKKWSSLSKEFTDRIKALDKGSPYLDVLEKKIRLCKSKTKKEYLPKIYDPFLNGSYRGIIKRGVINEFSILTEIPVEYVMMDKTQIERIEIKKERKMRKEEEIEFQKKKKKRNSKKKKKRNAKKKKKRFLKNKVFRIFLFKGKELNVHNFDSKSKKKRKWKKKVQSKKKRKWKKTKWLSEWLSEWLTSIKRRKEQKTKWLSEWLSEWLTSIKRRKEQKTKWLSEWLSEFEWLSEWLSEFEWLTRQKTDEWRTSIKMLKVMPRWSYNLASEVQVVSRRKLNERQDTIRDYQIRSRKPRRLFLFKPKESGFYDRAFFDLGLDKLRQTEAPVGISAKIPETEKSIDEGITKPIPDMWMIRYPHLWDFRRGLIWSTMRIQRRKLFIFKKTYQRGAHSLLFAPLIRGILWDPLVNSVRKLLKSISKLIKSIFRYIKKIQKILQNTKSIKQVFVEIKKSFKKENQEKRLPILEVLEEDKDDDEYYAGENRDKWIWRLREAERERLETLLKAEKSVRRHILHEELEVESIEPSEFENYLTAIRGGRIALLLTYSKIRKWITLPLLIIAKNMVRLLLFRAPQWDADIRDWKKERHIPTTLDGTLIEDSEIWSENWEQEGGVEIKILYPFRLKPWHRSKKVPMKKKKEKKEEKKEKVPMKKKKEKKEEKKEKVPMKKKMQSKKKRKWKKKVSLKTKKRRATSTFISIWGGVEVDRTGGAGDPFVDSFYCFYFPIFKKSKKAIRKWIFKFRKIFKEIKKFLKAQIQKWREGSSEIKRDSRINKIKKGSISKNEILPALGRDRTKAQRIEIKMKDLTDKISTIRNLIKDIKRMKKDKKDVTKDKKNGFRTRKKKMSPKKTSYGAQKLASLKKKKIFQIFKRRKARLIRKSHSFIKWIVERIYADILLEILSDIIRCIKWIKKLNCKRIENQKIIKRIFTIKKQQEPFSIHYLFSLRHLFSSESRGFLNLSLVSQAYVFYKLSQTHMINSYKLRSVLQYDGASLFLNNEIKDFFRRQGIISSELKHKKLQNSGMNPWKNWLKSHYQYELSKRIWADLVPKKWRNRVNQHCRVENRNLRKRDSSEREEKVSLLINQNEHFLKTYRYDLLSYQSIYYEDKKDSYSYGSAFQVNKNQEISYTYNYNIHKKKWVDMGGSIPITSLLRKGYYSCVKGKWSYRISFDTKGLFSLKIQKDKEIKKDKEINPYNQKCFWMGIDWMEMNEERLNSLSDSIPWLFPQFRLFRKVGLFYNAYTMQDSKQDSKYEYEMKPRFIPIHAFFNQRLADQIKESEIEKKKNREIEEKKKKSELEEKLRSEVDEKKKSELEEKLRSEVDEKKKSELEEKPRPRPESAKKNRTRQLTLKELLTSRPAPKRIKNEKRAIQRLKRRQADEQKRRDFMEILKIVRRQEKVDRASYVSDQKQRSEENLGPGSFVNEFENEMDEVLSFRSDPIERSDQIERSEENIGPGSFVNESNENESNENESNENESNENESNENESNEKIIKKGTGAYKMLRRRRRVLGYQLYWGAHPLNLDAPEVFSPFFERVFEFLLKQEKEENQKQEKQEKEKQEKEKQEKEKQEKEKQEKEKQEEKQEKEKQEEKQEKEKQEEKQDEKQDEKQRKRKTRKRKTRRKTRKDGRLYALLAFVKREELEPYMLEVWDKVTPSNFSELVSNGVLIMKWNRMPIKENLDLIMYQTIRISLVHEIQQKNQIKRDRNHYDLLVPENILSSRRRRELRILSCLNSRNSNGVDKNAVFCNGNKVKTCGQFLDERKDLDRDKKKLIQLKFFLWPNYRLEDLACMNRYWFDTNNGSRFSMLRIHMYPRLKKHLPIYIRWINSCAHALSYIRFLYMNTNSMTYQLDPEMKK